MRSAFKLCMLKHLKTLGSPVMALAFALFHASTVSASCLGLGGYERIQNYCFLSTIDGKAIDYSTVAEIDEDDVLEDYSETVLFMAKSNA